MKNNNKQFPKTLEAFEVEQGINTNFNLCIEIANRYNNHDKLIEALKQAKEDIILLTSNSFGQSTCEWSTQYIDDLLQSIEQQ